MRLGTTEIILLIALAALIFGGGKLAGLGKALGGSIRDFRKEMRDMKGEEQVNAETVDAVDDDGPAGADLSQQKSGRTGKKKAD